MRRLIIWLCASCTVCLAGCAPSSLTESGRLSSYAALRSSDGVLTKTRVHAEKDILVGAKTVLLVPTVVDERASASGLTPEQLKLVSNAVDRSLCRDLGRRFVVVEPGQDAHLVVRAVITKVDRTDTTAAGVSVVTGTGSKVVSAVTGIPIPAPRIPLGMGSLTVEAEAQDPQRRQAAAIVWARGADALTTSARIADEGDAHALAGEFAADFAKLLLTGADPIANRTPTLPSGQTISEYLGGAPKYEACKRFGPHPGFGDTIGSVFGAPPSWTDKGAK